MAVSPTPPDLCGFGSRTARVILAILLLVPWLAPTSMAGADQTDPAAVVRDFGASAIDVMSREDISAGDRELAFRRLFTSYFDVEAIGRFVLGPYWRKASSEEREAYQVVFEDFIVMTYAQRLTGYSGEVFDVGPTRLRGEAEATVSSRIVRDPDAPVELDWLLKRKGEGWRIVDLKVSGISMAQTRRAEFSTVLKQHGGLPNLLIELRKMTERVRHQA